MSLLSYVQVVWENRLPFSWKISSNVSTYFCATKHEIQKNKKTLYKTSFPKNRNSIGQRSFFHNKIDSFFLICLLNIHKLHISFSICFNVYSLNPQISRFYHQFFFHILDWTSIHLHTKSLTKINNLFLLLPRNPTKKFSHFPFSSHISKAFRTNLYFIFVPHSLPVLRCVFDFISLLASFNRHLSFPFCTLPTPTPLRTYPIPLVSFASFVYFIEKKIFFSKMDRLGMHEKLFHLLVWFFLKR